MKNVESLGRMANGENLPNPGEYVLLICLAVVLLGVLVGTIILGPRIAQFVNAVQNVLMDVGR
ncbi:MAG: hypothetical protein AB7G75_21370 [Candidatus Binatia bacterium]